MTTAGNRGHVAFGIQDAKIGDGTFTSPSSLTAGAWQRHKMVNVDLAVTDMRDALPPTVGGGYFIDGTYKNGVAVAGTILMDARLQGSLGYLLYAAAGSYSATATSSNAKGTRFYVDQTNQQTLPWLAFRKYTPGSTGTDGVTEYMVDCKVAAMTIRIPQMGAVNTEVSFIGRRPIAYDGELTANASAYEAASGVALSCKSNVSATFDVMTTVNSAYNVTSSSDEPFIGAEITLINGLTGPQQEMVIGSYYMDDIVPLTRAAAIRLVYKWKNPKLYDRMYYDMVHGGNATAVNWTPQIQTGNAVITAASAAGTPSMVFNTNSNLDWAIEAPRLTGGQMITCNVTAILKDTLTAGQHPWYIDLFNSYDYATNFAAS